MRCMPNLRVSMRLLCQRLHRLCWSQSRFGTSRLTSGLLWESRLAGAETSLQSRVRLIIKIGHKAARDHLSHSSHRTVTELVPDNARLKSPWLMEIKYSSRHPLGVCKIFKAHWAHYTSIWNKPCHAVRKWTDVTWFKIQFVAAARPVIRIL